MHPSIRCRLRRGLRVMLVGLGYAAAARPADAGAQRAPATHGWTAIFDGQTLAGWTGSRAFVVETGSLVGRASNLGEDLCTERDYGDFVLRFRARAGDPASGASVAFRAKRVESGNNQWLRTPVAFTGIGFLGDHKGLVFGRGDDDARRRMRDTAEWNDHVIYANGSQVRLFVNGVLLNDAIVHSAAALPRAGAICLSAGGLRAENAVRFRDIEVRALTPRPEGPLAAPHAAVRFRKHVVSHDFISEGAATADVDRDGDLDVIAGAAWFEAPSWRAREIRPVKPFSVHRGYSDSFLNFALDVNRDGWMDVIQFDFPGRAGYWYENPAGRPGPWTRRVVHPAVASESPRFEDVNGDGREDLLFVDAAARQVVWMEAPKMAGDTTWTRHPVSEPLPATRSRIMAHGLGFDDMDGDGQRDVIALDAWWKARALPDASWEEHYADLGAPAAQMYAFDADGDGDRDVVSSSAHDYGLWWHEQSRYPTGIERWIHHTIDERVSVMHALAVTDVDGDGTPDLVTGKRFLAHNGNDPGEFDPAVLLWYKGGRDAAGRPTWTPYLIDGETGIGLQIVIRDVTGDGRDDIVSSSKKGVLVFERLK